MDWKVSMGLVFRHHGSYRKTQRSLQNLSARTDTEALLHRYGKLGVQYLRDATPQRTGATANAWSYEVERTSSGYTLVFNNSNSPRGVNVAILLQYGHGTRNGGYVRGLDYINPAARKLFQQMADELWLEVKIS